MNASFLAKFTATEGLPDPLVELASIVEQTSPGDGMHDDHDRDFAWFATRLGKTGNHYKGARCMVFARLTDGSIEAVSGTICDRRTSIPDDAFIKELYGEQHQGVWWKIKDVESVKFRSIDDLPGRSKTGRTATETFAGSCSFAYWNFDGTGAVKKCDSERGHAAARPYPTAGLSPDFSIPSSTLLHGVDFSGARETYEGNQKLWIASWDTASGFIDLINGVDGNFRRADLPKRIADDGGWWVIDFPFGIAAEIGAVLPGNVNNLSAWLEFCNHDGRRGDDYPRHRRDAARAAAIANNVVWSTRRQIDIDNQTTWFPLFEQLYKQTITGAAEVLFPLHTQFSGQVSILPWHPMHKVHAHVVEGFPGLVLRGLLGLSSTGYKGQQAGRRERREMIVSELRRVLPISTAIAAAAINDAEGDALDALLLLLSAAQCANTDRQIWQYQLQRLEQTNRMVEGWFPSAHQ